MITDSGVERMDYTVEQQQTDVRGNQQPKYDIMSSSSRAPLVVALSEEDAKQVIDMLRSDDMGARVAAAHRLDLVAVTLGEQRTREVRVANAVISHSPLL